MSPDAITIPRMAKRHSPKKASAGYLERAALFHLQRHSSTVAGLRRILQRRVTLSVKFHGTDAEEGKALIEALLARFERAGLLDDSRFARFRAESLHRRGTSVRGITAKLRAKGVATPQVQEAIATLRSEGDDREPDLEAAFALARRRHLGPFRAAADRESRRQKDLAALLRAGFSFGVAKKVLASEAPE
jgi:regulatory protein